jgi:hypothetical protein
VKPLGVGHFELKVQTCNGRTCLAFDIGDGEAGGRRRVRRARLPRPNSAE